MSSRETLYVNLKVITGGLFVGRGWHTSEKCCVAFFPPVRPFEVTRNHDTDHRSFIVEMFRGPIKSVCRDGGQYGERRIAPCRHWYIGVEIAIEVEIVIGVESVTMTSMSGICEGSRRHECQMTGRRLFWTTYWGEENGGK